MLRANELYNEGKYDDCIALLCEIKANGLFEAEISNNMACAYFNMNQQLATSLSLARALELQAEQESSNSVSSDSNALVVVKNLGIYHSTKLEEDSAINCFEICEPKFHNDPDFWARRANSILQSVKTKFQQPLEDGLVDATPGLVASSSAQQLPQNLPETELLPNFLTSSWVRSKVADTLFPEFKPALLKCCHYLRIALCLLNKGSTNQSNEASQLHTTSLRKWVLLNLAFVELCLENAMSAKSLSDDLLASGELSNHELFLAHCYKAEAVCWQNKPQEGALHSVLSLNAKLADAQEETNSEVESEVTCGAINAALTHLMSGKSERANILYSKFLEAKFEKDAGKNSTYQLAKMYIESATMHSNAK